ncbi:MAG: T9SS type A sorting domain-containing protein [Bacteroidetes bacterium]|nr:T9SS type A sorting domain-containing protein [Bacteroidota bacterium]
MKKIIYSAAFVCISAIANAQSIPNGNFEAWTSGTYEYPQYYPYTSNTDAFFRYQTPFNCVKTTDAYQGTYAVQLTTNASATDTAGAYFVNPINGEDPSTWTGGIPYTQKPTGIRGYYKYNVASSDSGLIIVTFSNGGINIGSYFFKVGGIKTTYTLFNFTLSPALAITPDSVVFAATSSDFMVGNGIPGSILKIDSISFTGVTSQPAQMNGSFETWLSQTVNRPDNWYLGGGDGNGMNRTTDAAAGNYAIELTTYLGSSKSGPPTARSGQVSTGYYKNNCSGPNCQKGGYPFSNQQDTLVFSYKYVPSGNDSAQVWLNFKKSGSQIWSTGKNLAASATYQTVQIPFNVGQAPDTVIVQAQSSLWQDSALTYIGSNLKIDEIHFKSQPLNTSVPVFSFDNHISVFPNPSNGKANVIISQFEDLKMKDIEIYNMYGAEVAANFQINSSSNFQIDLSEQPDGIYLIKMTSNGKTFTKKLIVNK